MAENLQQLIDRIKKEGIAAAKTEADAILAKAKTEAAAMRVEAEKAAKALNEKAEKDAKLFEERGKQALEQAGRDLVITVKGAVEALFSGIVASATGQAVKGEVLDRLIEKIAGQLAGQKAEIQVSREDKDAVTRLLSSKFKDLMAQGLEVKPSGDVIRGFKVLFKDRNMSLDFTGEAIAQSLSVFLRPQLAEILTKAAGK